MCGSTCGIASISAAHPDDACGLGFAGVVDLGLVAGLRLVAARGFDCGWAELIAYRLQPAQDFHAYCNLIQ